MLRVRSLGRCQRPDGIDETSLPPVCARVLAAGRDCWQFVQGSCIALVPGLEVVRGDALAANGHPFPPFVFGTGKEPGVQAMGSGEVMDLEHLGAWHADERDGNQLPNHCQHAQSSKGSTHDIHTRSPCRALGLANEGEAHERRQAEVISGTGVVTAAGLMVRRGSYPMEGMQRTVPPVAPLFEQLALELPAHRVDGKRLVLLEDELLFQVAEHALPHATQLGAIAPVALQSGAWALTFTHQEETAVLATAVLLRCLIESKIALVARSLRLDEVDAVLVGSPTVAGLTIALDAAYRLGCIGVAGTPDAGGVPVLAQQAALHLVQHVEAKMLQFRLQVGKTQQGAHVLFVAEAVGLA